MILLLIYQMKRLDILIMAIKIALFLNIIVLSNACAYIGRSNTLSAHDNNVFILKDNERLPMIEYCGQKKYITPCGLIQSGCDKIHYSKDTLISHYISVKLAESKLYQEDAIYRFFISIQIDENGKVLDIKEYGENIHEIIKNPQLERLFKQEIELYMKQLNIMPATINGIAVKCRIVVLIVANPMD